MPCNQFFHIIFEFENHQIEFDSLMMNVVFLEDKLID